MPDLLPSGQSAPASAWRRAARSLALLLPVLLLLAVATPTAAAADNGPRPLPYPAEAYPDDIKRIKLRGKLVVSQFKGYEPLFFFNDEKGRDDTHPSVVENGQRIIGVDITLAHEIARLLGVKLEVRRSAESFNDVCREVAAGKADLGISALTITPERAVFVRFSEPYASFRMGALINRRLAAEVFALKVRYWDQPQTYLDNEAVTIAQQPETAQEALVKRLFPKASILNSRGAESGPREVAAGNALATLVNEYYAKFLFRKTPELGVQLKWIPIPKETDHLAVAVSPMDTHLLSFVNVVITGRSPLTDINEALNLYHPELSTTQLAPRNKTQQPAAMAERSSVVSLLVTGAAMAVLFVLWAMLSRSLRGARDKREKEGR